MATADAILRDPALQGDYKVELAVQGNLTQLVNSAGTRLASISTAGTPDSGFVVGKVIDGEEWHYDPTVDLYNNFLQQGAGDITIDLGAVLPFNQFVLYQHPTLPNATRITLSGSTDNITYTILIPSVNVGTKTIIDYASFGLPTLLNMSYRYIKIHPVTLSSDSKIRICELQIFNWVDVTNRILDKSPDPENSDPAITISIKGDMLQNAIPTPSDLSMELQNVDGYFSPTNANSPIYGILQPDGQGSGVRSGVNVRVQAMATSKTLGSFTQQVFYGYIANDNNPGGTDGATIDTSATTITIVCKSLFSRLVQAPLLTGSATLNAPAAKNLNPPVYEGATADYIVKDICVRAGIALQDVNCPLINQGVPFIGFNQGSGASMLNQLFVALPFMRAYETFDPGPTLNIVNYGRTRTDISIQRFTSSAASGGSANYSPHIIPKNTLCVPSLKKTFLFERDHAGEGLLAPFPENVWVWDMTKPIGGSTGGDTGPGAGNGLTLFGADLVFRNTVSWVLVGTILYVVDNAGIVSSCDLSLSTLGAITTVGTITGGNLVSACGFGNFIYYWQSNNNLVVWDTTKAFSTRVSKGIVTNAPAQSNFSNSPNQQQSAMGVDGTYFFYKYYPGGGVSSSTNAKFAVWKHNGTPYTTAFTFVDVLPFSAVTIGGENYSNYSVAYSSNGILGIFIAVQKGSGLYRQEIWTFDIGAAYAGSVTNATKQGVVQDDTSALAVAATNANFSPDSQAALVPGSNFSIAFNGTYLYFGDSEYNMWVWDTTKAFSFLFQLGFNMQAPNAAPPAAPSYQTPQYIGVANIPSINFKTISHVGPEISSLDHTNRIWFSNPTPFVSGASFSQYYGREFGFTVQGVSQFPSVPSASFDILDGFMANAVISRGNPTANRVRVSGNQFTLGGNFATLWSQQPTEMAMWFPSNKKTSIVVPMTSLSWRGIGSPFRRFLSSTLFTSPVPDNPTASTSYNGHPINFFAMGDLGVITVDNTGLGAVVLTNLSILGVTVNQVLNSMQALDKRDDASYRMNKNQEFLYEPISPAFNDYSFFQDILLNGKFARPYIQAQQTPWYPVYTIGQIIQLTDSVDQLPATLFEVVEYSLQGFKTTMKAKQIFSSFTI